MLSYIIVYTCLWWIIFYITLPIGNRISTKIEKGHADSAPTNPRLSLKALITSIVTFPITYLIVKAIENKTFIKLFANFLN